MANLESMFSEKEKQTIEAAIVEAEKLTSGEIRVHVDDFCNEPVMDRAAFMFSELDMHKTALRNGVLIYLSTEDRQLAVIGDAGIHAHVGDSFWSQLRQNMVDQFQKDQYTAGLCGAILHIGDELKKHFPYQSNDTNELPNTISFGNSRKH
jgi:uncharacterized membrane protein